MHCKNGGDTYRVVTERGTKSELGWLTMMLTWNSFMASPYFSEVMVNSNFFYFVHIHKFMHSELELELAAETKRSGDATRKMTAKLEGQQSQIESLKKSLDSERRRSAMLVEKKEKAEMELQMIKGCGKVSYTAFPHNDGM